ncbi:hypothetical protein K2173_002363 [Erythroxylum novogranatense]|uniref:(S)-hydroxynitrile lyase n=1 Tax=Erythroxylum novogranatense TaxID=1862640 RepID=A0AAV8T9U4_9ROSI|nr:hypothetical protein K2173_002363 [Erythroxylum novogranatense]
MKLKEKPWTLISFSISLLCLVHGNLSESPNSVPSSHFVLIHGSCHGAWSWYKIVALIKSSGNKVTSIDLAASGIDPQQVNTLSSVSEYHRPLMDFMASLPPHEKVILVGHSLGGLAVSQAMERYPEKVKVSVFVTASMPGPSLNISTLNQESFRSAGSLMDSRYTYDNGTNNAPTTLILGPMLLKSRLYQLSPIEDWTLATTLVRPLRLFTEEDLSRKLVLTSEKYGSVRRVFIISEKDKLAKKDFVEWMIKRNPPNQVLEVLGSDHMVMMSKPRQLWVHLLKIAAKYH